MPKQCIGIFILLLLSACGGGGDTASPSNSQNAGTANTGSQANTANAETTQTSGTSNSGSTDNAGTTSNQQTNTPAALNYINSRHSSVQSSFRSAAEPLAAKHSALGSLNGGNHLAESMELYASKVQDFLNDSVATANSLHEARPVNLSTIAAALNDYRKIDIDYAQSYYSAWPFGGLRSTSTLDNLQSRLNNSYDSAILSLN